MEKLSGNGAVGSPGGTHPIIVNGTNVHAVWWAGGNIWHRGSEDSGKTWGHARKIVDSGKAVYPCSLEQSGSVLYLLWPDERNAGKWEIYYKRSTDDGKTWGDEKRLTPGVDFFRWGTAVSGDAVHITWATKSVIVPTKVGKHTWGEIYYKRSIDGGLTWGPDVRLTEPKESAMRPSIAASGKFVHVTWFDRRDSTNVWDWDVYYKRSTDGGATWGPDVRMTATWTHTRHPQIVVTPGKVCLIWEDGSFYDGKKWDGKAAMYAAVSTDNGATWGKPVVIGSFGNATHSKSYACGSRIHVVWTDAVEGSGERVAAAPYYSTSPDGGLTWTAPEKLYSPAKGERWDASGVAGTESYAVVLILNSETINVRRQDLDYVKNP